MIRLSAWSAQCTWHVLSAIFSAGYKKGEIRGIQQGRKETRKMLKRKDLHNFNCAHFYSFAAPSPLAIFERGKKSFVGNFVFADVFLLFLAFFFFFKMFAFA